MTFSSMIINSLSEDLSIAFYIELDYIDSNHPMGYNKFLLKKLLTYQNFLIFTMQVSCKRVFGGYANSIRAV